MRDFGTVYPMVGLIKATFPTGIHRESSLRRQLLEEEIEFDHTVSRLLFRGNYGSDLVVDTAQNSHRPYALEHCVNTQGGIAGERQPG